MADRITRARWRYNDNRRNARLSAPPLWADITQSVTAWPKTYIWEIGGFGRTVVGSASSMYAAQRAVRAAFRAELEARNGNRITNATAQRLARAGDTLCSVCGCYHDGRCPDALDSPSPGSMLAARDRNIAALSLDLLDARKERDALTAERDRLAKMLAAEQGRNDGAPSKGWQWHGGGDGHWWFGEPSSDPGQPIVFLDGRLWACRVGERVTWKPTALEAMEAYDAFLGEASDA